MLFFSGCPFGLLPTLEVDGQLIAESNAICRFIAKKVGLYGEDAIEQAHIDMVIDNMADMDHGKHHFCCSSV